MPPAAQHRRRVGTVRPSHLMFTGGVGALVDLPNFPVLIRGLDDWRYDTVPDWAPLPEPRLLAAVGKLLGAPVMQLRAPPWLDGFDADPNGQASRVGVPVIPFPQWLRCTACSRLASIDAGIWGFVNDKARRPDEAKFFHDDCPRRRRRPLAVAARFVLACVERPPRRLPLRCVRAPRRRLPGGQPPGSCGWTTTAATAAPTSRSAAPNCPAKRNIRQAMGRRGEKSLPACRGRHPHLGTFGTCDARPLVIVVGASNMWFAQTLSALAVPAARRQRAAGQGGAAVGAPAERDHSGDA